MPLMEPVQPNVTSRETNVPPAVSQAVMNVLEYPLKSTEHFNLSIEQYCPKSPLISAAIAACMSWRAPDVAAFATRLAVSLTQSS